MDLEHVTIATGTATTRCWPTTKQSRSLPSKSPQKAEIVKLRYFTGMEHAEIAAVLGIAEPTVRRGLGLRALVALC